MDNDERIHLLANVANLYYEHNMTQSEIANRLFISRSKISRLLKEARDKNIVEIIINEPWKRVEELEKEFLKKFELKDIRILDTKNLDYETSLFRIGELSAYYIDGLLNKNTILGMSWGNTVYHTVQCIHSNKNIPLNVVQIMGSASRDNPELDSIDLAKQFATMYGGKYHYIYAPIFVRDKIIKETLLKDPYIWDSISLAKKSKIILTSVGAIDSSLKTHAWTNYITPAIKDELISSGAVGHIGGHFYNINGEKIDIELEEYFIGIDLKDFIKVPNVICVACSKEKANAILGAIKGGYINTLIIDNKAALEILNISNHLCN